jgi:hypothetical protein
MTRDEAVNGVTHALERWGFPALVALALGYFLRQDLLLPLLESHRETLKEIRETQREIAGAVSEQTRLLYALQPKMTKTPSGE